MAEHLLLIFLRIAKQRRWPLEWVGGVLIELFKGKGEKEIMDHYRGLLLQPHASKAACSILRSHITDKYDAHQPDMQCGATRGRGTDFASHFVAAAIEFASKASLCIAVVFLDLIKAFDRVLRELVLGLPSDVRSVRGITDHFIKLGMAPEESKQLARYLVAHGWHFPPVGHRSFGG